MNRLSPTSLGLAVVLAIAAPIRAQHHDHEHGKVDFETSCEAEAQEHFRTGVALLHHMMYEQAEEAFVEAARIDPECAMAHWGVAMSVVHPLWAERPTDAAHQKGEQALARARAANHATERELAYIEALEAFYRDWESTPYPAQLEAFEAGFSKLHEAWPDDVDAATFYALAHLATAPKGDQTVAHQLKAGALLEELHKQAPEHPGTFHYLIHAYDHPLLAIRALDIARAYDKLAPDVPHALHMPSHIFVRLGYWRETIDWNARSAAAALRQPIGDMTSGHYAHAKDYMIYAHIQRGEFAEARDAIERMEAVDNFQPWLATSYALAAMHPRYTLERRDWAAAAAITRPTAGGYPWENYPAAESILHYARGLGAARSGDADSARAAMTDLEAIQTRLTDAGEGYWAILTDAQRKAVAAWIDFADGDHDGALALMTEAADLEDSVDKHPITPGHVLPARELLGDMLLLLDRPADAHEAFRASLAISPRRTNALEGAARSAERLGDLEAARAYYAEMMANLVDADAETPQMLHAKRLLASN